MYIIVSYIVKLAKVQYNLLKLNSTVHHMSLNIHSSHLSIFKTIIAISLQHTHTTLVFTIVLWLQLYLEEELLITVSGFIMF